MLLAEHTGTHQPLDVDWSFARDAQPLSTRSALVDAAVPVTGRSAAPAASTRRSATSHAPASPALVVAPRREPVTTAAPFASLLEFAVAVNRARSRRARAGARRGAPRSRSRAPRSGSSWGRYGSAASCPTLSAAWRTRLFDALRTSTEWPNHVVRVGRRQARVSELSEAQLREVAAGRSPLDPVRQDVELLADIARAWGDDAIRQLPFRETGAPPARSGFASLLRGIGMSAKSGPPGAP